MPHPATIDDLTDVLGLIRRASSHRAELGDTRSAKEVGNDLAKEAGVPSLRASIQRLHEIIAERERELKARAAAEDDSA